MNGLHNLHGVKIVISMLYLIYMFKDQDVANNNAPQWLDNWFKSCNNVKLRNFS